MSLKDISKEKVVKALAKNNGVMTHSALMLGVAETTLRRWVRHYKISPQDYYLPDSSLDPDRIEKFEKEQLRQLTKKAKFLTDRILVLEKGLSKWNLLREEILKLKDVPVSLPKWTVSSASNKSKEQRTRIPVLFTSDFQWGEVISSAELDGINAYNVDIAKRRYRELIKASIDIAFNYQTNPVYPGMVYLRGGDTVSGDIHEELKLTNQLTSVMQVFDVLCEEAKGINELLKHFKEIIVISVPGNHGRTTIKPLSKAYATTNYDYLISLLLEKFFEDDPRVKFYTPISGDFYFNIYGTRFLLTHGDRIGSSGGQGFVGPSATISRGVKKIRDQYSSLGKPVDWVLCGHFHVSMMLEHALINGSLPGYSEYAQRFRMDPQPPIQLMWFVDPKWGIEQVRRITLEEGNEDPQAKWFLPK